MSGRGNISDLGLGCSSVNCHRRLRFARHSYHQDFVVCWFYHPQFVYSQVLNPFQ